MSVLITLSINIGLKGTFLALSYVNIQVSCMETYMVKVKNLALRSFLVMFLFQVTAFNVCRIISTVTFSSRFELKR